MKKVPCKYCLQPIDPRGMPSHVHFKHVDYVIREFALNPYVTLFTYGELPTFAQLQLQAPRDNYSESEVWKPNSMLAPVSQVPRWMRRNLENYGTENYLSAVCKLLREGYGTTE